MFYIHFRRKKLFLQGETSYQLEAEKTRPICRNNEGHLNEAGRQTKSIYLTNEVHLNNYEQSLDTQCK